MIIGQNRDWRAVAMMTFGQCVKETKAAIVEARKAIDKMAAGWRPAFNATTRMREVLHTTCSMTDSELEQWLELCKECNLLVVEYHKKRWEA